MIETAVRFPVKCPECGNKKLTDSSTRYVRAIYSR